MNVGEVSKSVCESKRVCVVIPTYNNSATLRQVISDVLNYTDHVLVVNDGSTDDTEKILEGFPQIRVIRYEKNKGKGYALRTAFKAAIDLNYNYAITIDSDGQHFADDISTFLNSLTDNPETIVIGARNMDQAGVPGKSSFGNKFSNFWFWVETGYKLPDTQSGFRMYPLNALKDISFVTRKYEFEIEVLVRSAWKGVNISTVPIKVHYASKAERVSHFRPFKDFTRISILNTVLVFLTFAYIKPRNLFQGLKKKIQFRFSRSYSSIPTRVYR